jgi:hypothetical protein
MSKLNNVASDIPPVVLVEYSLNHLRGQERALGMEKELFWNPCCEMSTYNICKKIMKKRIKH